MNMSFIYEYINNVSETCSTTICRALQSCSGSKIFSCNDGVDKRHYPIQVGRSNFNIGEKNESFPTHISKSASVRMVIPEIGRKVVPVGTIVGVIIIMFLIMTGASR